MVKIPRSKKLYSDDGDFDYMESDPEYDPSGGDPLRKKRKMDFIGGEMDELGAGGANKKGSTAGGPMSNPTQYGDVGAKESVPFEGQQRQMLSPQRGVEEAIENAMDQEISNLEKAIKSSDSVEEMRATGEINRLQNELTKELKVSQAAQETMGDTYETRALRQRVTQSYGGKVDLDNVEYMIEDAKPLPTTSKGKGKGIKSSEAIIQTGLESKEIAYDKLKDGEYSQSASSKSQASVEKALREGARPGSDKPKFYVGGTEPRLTPYDYRESMSGDSRGILGQASKDPGGPTFTGVDRQGNIQQPRQAIDFGDTSHLEAGKGDTYFNEIGTKTPGGRQKFNADNEIGNTNPDGPYTSSEPPKYNSQERATRKFAAGNKISGNKVGSVTPDAPKAVISNEGFNLKEAYNDSVSKGMTPRQAQKNAERLQRLSKIKGKGKGKGKLFTTLGAIGIGAILNKDR